MVHTVTSITDSAHVREYLQTLNLGTESIIWITFYGLNRSFEWKIGASVYDFGAEHIKTVKKLVMLLTFCAS